MKELSTSIKSLLIILILLNIILLSFVSYTVFNNNKDLLATERIDIKDNTGNNRIVISNANRIPDPIIGGKTFQRAYTPAGLIFYDKNGDESGDRKSVV